MSPYKTLQRGYLNASSPPCELNKLGSQITHQSKSSSNGSR